MATEHGVSRERFRRAKLPVELHFIVVAVDAIVTLPADMDAEVQLLT
ncbi:MAG: hypothetical protein V2J89_04840 [Halieaceae bacterium]|nr:hypothetical protein [Halieaceae bacterium]